MNKLQKSFKTLFSLEKKARDIYSKILLDKPAKQIAEKIKFIRNQEIGHMAMADILIGISKKAEKRKEEPEIPADIFNYLNQDIILKRNLLGTIKQFIDMRIKSIKLISLMGSKTEEFKKMDKSRRALIDITVHQLKTPLTITRWSSELLGKKDKLNKYQKEILESIKISNRSMIFLVNDLLETSKIEEKEKLKFVKFDLVKLCGNIIRESSQLARAKKQNINFEPFQGSILVSNNEEILRKIIYNLLTNAIQYGNGDILLRIKKQQKGVMISVSDNGIGIPKNEQKNIFKKFFRASNAQKFYGQGTGLGLYIVKELAKKINGKIWFDSKENKGTTFFLSL